MASRPLVLSDPWTRRLASPSLAADFRRARSSLASHGSTVAWKSDSVSGAFSNFAGQQCVSVLSQDYNSEAFLVSPAKNQILLLPKEPKTQVGEASDFKLDNIYTMTQSVTKTERSVMQITRIILHLTFIIQSSLSLYLVVVRSSIFLLILRTISSKSGSILFCFMNEANA
jgi:hypothetical protein